MNPIKKLNSTTTISRAVYSYYSTSSARLYVENTWSRAGPGVRVRERPAPASQIQPQPQAQPAMESQEEAIPQSAEPAIRSRVGFLRRPYLLFGILSSVWLSFGWFTYQHRDQKGAARDMYAMQHIQNAVSNTKPLQYSLPMSPNAIQQQQQQPRGHPEEQGVKSIGAYLK